MGANHVSQTYVLPYPIHLRVANIDLILPISSALVRSNIIQDNSPGKDTYTFNEASISINLALDNTV